MALPLGLVSDPREMGMARSGDGGRRNAAIAVRVDDERGVEKILR